MSQQFAKYLKDVCGFAESLSENPIVKEAVGKAEGKSQDQLKIIIIKYYICYTSYIHHHKSYYIYLYIIHLYLMIYI